MNKLLIVYNTYGGMHYATKKRIKDNLAYYIKAIGEIFDAGGIEYGFKVAVSACQNNPLIEKALVKEFGDTISYNFISECLPVNVTFNHTVLKCVEKFGEFDGYFYVDSGILFNYYGSLMEALHSRLSSENLGMITVKTDDDTGFTGWFGRELAPDEEYYVPLGKACNLHTTIFSNEIYKSFGQRLLPDIFAANCTESTFSFLNASIGRRWLIWGKPVLKHAKSVDGASAGFGFKHPWDYTFRSPRTMTQIIMDPEAKLSGFGYEECNRVLMHDASKYDANGFAKDDRLLKFIQKNLYLSKESLDYNKIRHEFVRGKTAREYAND